MNIILELAGGVLTIVAFVFIIKFAIDIAVLFDNLPRNRKP